eukprot:g6373.t1
MSSENVLNVDGVITKPKQPFLRRGEGTRRRVFASKYKEEAKQKRQENLQKAQHRQTHRTATNVNEVCADGSQMESVTPESRLVSLVNIRQSTFSPEVVKDGPTIQPERLEYTIKDDSVQSILSNDVSTPKRDSNVVEAPLEDALENTVLYSDDRVPEMNDENTVHDVEAQIDGSCRIGDPAMEHSARSHPVEDAERALSLKEARQANWLESQRICEERQWTEAKLQEFEALERQIIQDTEQRLQSTEAAIKKKHVSFQEPWKDAQTVNKTAEFHTSPQEETTLAGKPSSSSLMNRGAFARKGSRHKRGMQQRQQDVEKLKALSASRGVRQTSGSNNAPKRPSPRTTSSSRSIHATSTRPNPANKASSGVELQTPEGFDRTIVDSAYLNQLMSTSLGDTKGGSVIAGEGDENPRHLTERLKLQSERAELENEKIEWQHKQTNAMVQFEAMKAEELKKLKRERRVLEQQSKALMKLPSKKERSEIEGLEAILDQERKETKSKEARHKLTVERLRDQINQLQITNKELQDEIKWHEEMHLLKENKTQEESEKELPIKVPVAEIGTQTESVQGSSPLDGQETYNRNQERWSFRLENPFFSESSYPDQRPNQGLTQMNTETQYRNNESFKIEQTNICNTPGVPPQVPGGVMTQNPVHAEQAQRAYKASQHPGTSFQRVLPPAWNLPVSTPFSSWYPMPELQSNVKNERQWGGYTSQLPMSTPHGMLPFSNSHYGQGAMTIPSFVAQGVHQMPRMTGNDCQGNPPFMYSGETNRFQLPLNDSLAIQNQPLPSRTDSCMNPVKLMDYSKRDPATEDHFPSQRNEFHHKISPSTADWVEANSVHRPPPPPPPENDSSFKLLHPASMPYEENSSLPQRDQITFQGDSTNIKENRVIQNPQTHQSARAKVQEAQGEEGNQDPQVSRFDNGTIKQSFKDGRVVVWFGNSDVKHVHPCGRVEYFYSDLNTWQVTYKNKIEVFYFDIGQVEAHKTNGDKDIIFPDGSIRTVLKNGVELDAGRDEVAEEIRFPKPEIPCNKPEQQLSKKCNRDVRCKYRETA